MMSYMYSIIGTKTLRMQASSSFLIHHVPALQSQYHVLQIKNEYVEYKCHKVTNEPCVHPDSTLRHLHTCTNRINLLYDESVPALNESSQVALALFIVRVSQDQTKCRRFRDCTECSQEVVCLIPTNQKILHSTAHTRQLHTKGHSIGNGLPLYARFLRQNYFNYCA